MNHPPSHQNVLHYASPARSASERGGAAAGPSDEVKAKRAVRDKLEIVHRGKWIILAIFSLVMAGTVAYTLTTSPVYEAYTLLMVDPQPVRSGEESLAGVDLLDGGGLGNRNVSNQALVIQQSLAIAERTAEELMRLSARSEAAPLRVLQPNGAGQPPTSQELAVRLQSSIISVEPQQEGVDALWIRAASTAPGEAALIANVFAGEYVQRTRETSRQHLTASRDFLEEQIAKLQGELSSAEESIRAYRTTRGAVDLDEETRHTIAQIAQLEADLDEVRIDWQMHDASLQSLDRELSQIQPRLAQRVASSVEQEIHQTQEKIAELEFHTEQVLLRNPSLREAPDENSDLRETRRQIAQYRSKVQTLSEQYVSEMLAVGGIDPSSEVSGMGYVARLNQQLVDERVALSGLEAKENALEERLDTYTRNLRTIPSESTELARLERTQQSTEQLYVSLVERLQEARIAEESELGFARVIRPALAPTAPVRPRRGLNLLLGALVGLLFGVGAAAARHKLDTRVYTPDALRSADHHLLSVIPDMRPMIYQDFRRQQEVTIDGRTISTTLAALLSPFSPAAEAYRRLYMRLRARRAGAALRTVLITSPEEAAGKSTTAINLGVTAARAGKRTLIVDADLRKPALLRYLGLPERPTFGALLQDEAAPLEVATFATGFSGLYAIGATATITNPSELLESPRMDVLRTWFEEHFDLVIFDSSPVLLATDALVLAGQCDATVLVASSGSTGAEALTEAVEELREVGAQVAGTVLNRFDPAHMYGYRMYDTYGNRAAYGHQPDAPRKARALIEC